MNNVLKFNFIICFLIDILSVDSYALNIKRASVDIYNSTNKTVILSYSKINKDISNITKDFKDWDGCSYKIEAKSAFILTESFSDFNQFGGKNSETILCKIDVKYEDTTIGVINLVCSKYCPSPFFKFFSEENKYGISLKEEQPRGGGLTIFNIIHFSQERNVSNYNFTFE